MGQVAEPRIRRPSLFLRIVASLLPVPHSRYFFLSSYGIPREQRASRTLDALADVRARARNAVARGRARDIIASPREPHSPAQRELS